MMQEAFSFHEEPAPRAHARRTDPETSHAAARGILPFISQDRVLGALKDLGPMIDEKLCTLLSEFHTPSRIRTARKELQEKGLVEDSGMLGKTTRGRNAVIWRAV